MEREAFRQRMQQYKQARENNPQLKYWDWKSTVQREPLDDVYEDARFIDQSKPRFELRKGQQYYASPNNLKLMKVLGKTVKVLGPIGEVVQNLFPSEEAEILEDARYKYEKALKPKVYADGGIIDEDKVGNPSVQSIQQRQWLNNWLKNRTKQMAENIDFYSNQNYYGSAVDRFHVAPFFWQNKEKNAAKIIEEQLEYANSTPIYDYREPWIAADKSIPYRNKFLKQKLGVQGEFRSSYKQPRAISISPIAQDQSVILHELTHASQDLYKIQESVVNDILDKNNEKKDKYLDNPAEVYARLMQFRYDNNLNPTDTITKQQIEEWQKDKYIQDKQFINRYSSSTLEDLLNSVAMNYANGGIIDEDPPQNTSERPIINFDPKGDPYNPTYGYNPGAGYVRSVFDLYDAPVIGDALSIYDATQALKNKDWLGAGLAALTVVPFIPTVSNYKKSLNKQLNRTTGITPDISKLQKQSDWNDLRNRSIERLYDPEVRARAAKIKSD